MKVADGEDAPQPQHVASAEPCEPGRQTDVPLMVLAEVARRSERDRQVESVQEWWPYRRQARSRGIWAPSVASEGGRQPVQKCLLFGTGQPREQRQMPSRGRSPAGTGNSRPTAGYRVATSIPPSHCRQRVGGTATPACSCAHSSAERSRGRAQPAFQAGPPHASAAGEEIGA